MITAEQLRAARAMLRIEQGALAEKAGVSIETIKRFEAMQGSLKGRDDTIRSIANALEFAGIEFIDGEGANGYGGSGVRFAVDRSAKLRNRIADNIADMTRGLLSSAYVADEEIFDRGPDYLSYLINSALPIMIKDEMSEILDPKSQNDFSFLRREDR
jgi:transcriptional regulator with XRE-family HTH domain